MIAKQTLAISDSELKKLKLERFFKNLIIKSNGKLTLQACIEATGTCFQQRRTKQLVFPGIVRTTNI